MKHIAPLLVGLAALGITACGSSSPTKTVTVSNKPAASTTTQSSAQAMPKP